MAVNDMKDKGISPVYLVTDHIGFYEKYGWKFLCMVQEDGADLACQECISTEADKCGCPGCVPIE